MPVALCVLALARDEWPKAIFWGLWTLVGLVFWYQSRHRPEPGRFESETGVRGSRRGALLFAVLFGVASVVLFWSATLMPAHASRSFGGGAVLAILAGFFLWLAASWTTPRGRLHLDENIQQKDALKKGSAAVPATGPATPASTTPSGEGGTTWKEPPYFTSS